MTRPASVDALFAGRTLPKSKAALDEVREYIRGLERIAVSGCGTRTSIEQEWHERCETMRVSVTQITGDKLVQKLCSYTINGARSSQTLDTLSTSEHSPIYAYLFLVEMECIPTFVSSHLVRHHVGVSHYVKSNREDRYGHTGDAGRWQPTNHAMLINAKGLIDMARRRLCYQSHPVTRQVMTAIRKLLPATLSPRIVPNCIYRGAVCYEPKMCGLMHGVAHFEHNVAETSHRDTETTHERRGQ